MQSPMPPHERENGVFFVGEARGRVASLRQGRAPGRHGAEAPPHPPAPPAIKKQGEEKEEHDDHRARQHDGLVSGQNIFCSDGKTYTLADGLLYGPEGIVANRCGSIREAAHIIAGMHGGKRF